MNEQPEAIDAPSDLLDYVSFDDRGLVAVIAQDTRLARY